MLFVYTCCPKRACLVRLAILHLASKNVPIEWVPLVLLFAQQYRCAKVARRLYDDLVTADTSTINLLDLLKAITAPKKIWLVGLDGFKRFFENARSMQNIIQSHTN